MQHLFNCLSKPPDEVTRVAPIRRNLHLYIQNVLALQAKDNIKELTRLCRPVEKTSLTAQHYHLPTTNYRISFSL